ncbi:U1 zinc finger-domain-containing protein [Annulohypoxylon truncatum]|uniref:U1 zinc finger-domain-containing protein n=1 Tax=Annulohypoxylon truncatum TaxID=327061 RepID=UPI0020080280|nr:U1 zinc finger-domain-containing protein [Annulohypoxylon truncatum]KAI1207331.1 U1 zinc finger-domain-containing protein [Annulohypoxylon truncatum]
MPKFFCDYCDVYLTHDSMSVRKAHNSGRNHLRNVVDYYQQIGHEKAQSVIDSITSSYAAEGQAHANPMLPQNQPGGAAAAAAAAAAGGFPGMPPPPFNFPGGMPPPFPGLPGGMPPPPGGAFPAGMPQQRHQAKQAAASHPRPSQAQAAYPSHPPARGCRSLPHQAVCRSRPPARAAQTRLPSRSPACRRLDRVSLVVLRRLEAWGSRLRLDRLGARVARVVLVVVTAVAV